MRNRWYRLLLAGRRVVRRRRSPATPVIAVMGPRWLARILSFHARVVPFPPRGQGSDAAPVLGLVGPESGEGESPPIPQARVALVGYRSQVEPALDTSGFVEPTLANPSRLRLLRDLPPDLKILALQAARRVEVPQPRKWPSPGADVWLEETRSAHPTYRQAHSRHTRDLLEEAFAAAGVQYSPSDEEVTVVCVTNRPSNLDNVVDNFQRQRYSRRRLLLVTNSDDFDGGTVERALAPLPNSGHIHVDEHLSLGHSLNLALDSCGTRFMAKFDDDDWYGPEYLGDMMIAHRFADAAVVGQHTYYAYIEEKDETVLRFPGHEFGYTSYLAGGTLVIDVTRLFGTPFPDRTIGEDSGFLAACQRSGIDVYSADRFNYLQVRGGDNTWRPRLTEYLERTTPVASGRALGLVEA